MYEPSDYLKLWDFVKTHNYGNILEELEKYFNFIYDENEMNDIGLKLQIAVKKSRPMYLHGYVLSSALNKYIETNKTDNDIIIFETGTARGFSSIVMAKILEKFDKNGKIYTIDLNDVFDNCIKSSELKRPININECIEEWKSISDKYINFLKGDSKEIMKNLDNSLDRINFAFLDGSHLYKDLKKELEFVENKQKPGDVIICDDYTITQYPELCRAINEFIDKGKYSHKIFYGNDGVKKRGYVYLKKSISNQD